MRKLFTIFILVVAACGVWVFSGNPLPLNLGTHEWLPKALKQNALNELTPPKKHPQEPSGPLVVKEPLKPLQESDKANPEPPTASAVRIQGKWYAYNPRNLYMINGVPTYYDPGRKSRKAVDNLPQNVKPGQALEVVDRMATQAPLSVYSPQGVQATIDGAKDAARQAQEKNKVLDHLSRESDPPPANE